MSYYTANVLSNTTVDLAQRVQASNTALAYINAVAHYRYEYEHLSFMRSIKESIGDDDMRIQEDLVARLAYDYLEIQESMIKQAKALGNAMYSLECMGK